MLKENVRIDQCFLEVLQQQSPTAGIIFSYETALRNPISPSLFALLWMNFVHQIKEPQDSGIGGLSGLELTSESQMELLIVEITWNTMM
jgi:hypothetical protein